MWWISPLFHGKGNLKLIYICSCPSQIFEFPPFFHYLFVIMWWISPTFQRKGNLNFYSMQNWNEWRWFFWHCFRIQSFMTDFNAFLSGWQPSQVVRVDQHFRDQQSVCHQVSGRALITLDNKFKKLFCICDE